MINTTLEDNQDQESINNDQDSISESDIAKISKCLRDLPDPIDNLTENSITSDKNIDVSSKSLSSSCLVSGNDSNNSELSNLNGSTDTYQMLSSPIAPCILAFIVCLLLTFNMGIFVSNSFLVPFFIYEIHQCFVIYSIQKEQNNQLLKFLILSGLNRERVNRYFWIFKVLKKWTEDFSIYFCFIVLWELTVGLYI